MTSIHWDTVTRLRRLYAQAMDPVCRRFDLTANEMGVLLFLANNPQYTRAADIVSVRASPKAMFPPPFPPWKSGGGWHKSRMPGTGGA